MGHLGDWIDVSGQQVIPALGPGYLVAGGTMSGIATSVSPAHATASVAIDAAGFVTGSGAGPDFQQVLQGNIANLEIFVTTVSGTVTTGTVDSWVSLASRTWTKQSTGVGTFTYTGTYSIRVAGSGLVLMSGATFSLTATES